MNLIGTKVLETNRLILRRVSVADAMEAYNSWCSNPSVSRYLPWNTHLNVGVTEELYAFWEKEYEKSDVFRWIVELKETKELIGTIDVVSLDVKSAVAEVGYCYGEKFWGKGYGTEALKAVLKFLFMEVDCYLVFAKHYSKNIGSGMVMKKAGMHYETTLRDRVVDDDGFRNNIDIYSITKDEYLKENNNA